MRKKLLCTLLACALTMPTFAAMAEGEERNPNYIYDNFSLLGEEYDWGNDEEETVYINPAYAAALSKLRAIGVAGIDAYTELSGGETLTRGQFITLAARLMGSEVPTAEKEYFFDVAKNNEYAPYVAVAAERGYITGDGGLFRPDSEITYAEACTILVRALGQRISAENQSGWQNGYMIAANNAEITKSVKISNINSAAKKGDLYIMLVNTLESSSFATLQSVVGTTETYKDENVNMLKKYFDIVSGSGVITSVGDTGTLSSGNDNRVVINNASYIGDYSTYIGLLGQYVDFWYNEDEEELIFAAARENKNKTILLSAEEIKGFSSNSYEYEKDGVSSKRASLASSPMVIYNGRLATSGVNNLYIPEMGYVKLISNDGDTKFDYVIIESYRDYVVSSVNKDDFALYDEYKNEKGIKEKFSFKEENGKQIHFRDTNGKEIVPSLISKYDVVSVKESADGTYIDAVLSTTQISGKVTSVADNNGRAVLTIDGKEYTLNKTVTRECVNLYKAGSVVTVKLDCLGYGAAVIAGAVEDSKYAYLISVSYDEDSETSIAKVLTADDELKKLKLSDKCIIDGKRGKSVKDAYDALTAGTAEHKVIVFKTDEDGEYMTNIDTVLMSSSENDEQNLALMYDTGTGKLGYKATGNFQDKLYLSGNTSVFVVYNDSTMPDNKRFRAKKNTYLGNDATYAFKAYANKKSYVADAIVINMDVNTSLACGNHTTYIVTDIGMVWDENESESVYKLTLAYAGSTKEILVTQEEWNDNNYDVEVGDLVRAELEGDYVKEKALVVEYDKSKKAFSSETWTENGTGWEGAEFKQISGYVYEIRDNLLMMYATKTTDKTPMQNFDSSQGYAHVIRPSGFVKFTMRDGEATATSASISDLRAYVDSGDDCSRISAYMSWRMHGVMYILDYEE